MQQRTLATLKLIKEIAEKNIDVPNRVEYDKIIKNAFKAQEVTQKLEKPVAEPLLRPFNPPKLYLHLPGPIDAPTTKNTIEEFDKTRADGVSKNASTSKIPNSAAFTQPVLNFDTTQPLNNPVTTAESLKKSSSKQPQTHKPVCKPTGKKLVWSKQRLPDSIIEHYGDIVMKKCPAAWHMLDTYFSRLADPNAGQNRNELVALVFSNFEAWAAKRIEEMEGATILSAVTGYLTLVLQGKV
ncbi:hypothetical protein TWF730_007026 [Orbilia blumenaviensis]|uniref:Uncharacterized protein n=1 Tax=Orbilia blumenaviensis TaxID=1796055 RepID=A0AAV9VIB1_9PEZI